MNKQLSTSEIEQALSKAAKVGDLSGIKASIRGQVLSGIAQINPAPAANPLAAGLKWAPMALASLLIISSGTAALADSANPGDLLYPVDTFTESITGVLIKDQVAKAKFYATLSEERVAELHALETKDTTTLPESGQKRMEDLRKEAGSRAAIGLERLTQVEAAVREKYDTSENPVQKDAYLKLSKHLRQIIDRRAEKAETLKEILEQKEKSDEAKLEDRVRVEIRNKIRREFKLEDKPADYQFNDPNMPEELAPELRDGDKDGIPDREDQWVPRPLGDSIEKPEIKLWDGSH